MYRWYRGCCVRCIANNFCHISDPYKSNDVNIHVSYDRDEDSPPGNEQQQEQSSNIDGSTVSTGEAVDSEGTELVDGSVRQDVASAGLPAREGVAENEQTSTVADQTLTEPSKPAPSESTMEQKVSDKAPTENLVEKQLTESNKQEEIQTGEWL